MRCVLNADASGGQKPGHVLHFELKHYYTNINVTMVLESQLKGKPLTNYASYKDPISKTPRIGHYDASKKTIQPLVFISGTRVKDLYQVIEAGEDNIIASGSPVSLSSTKILAPITGRDILCVGKNYAAHAKEFNTSGFDSSDKVDIPTHPVIFTKRFSSIIGDGDEIHPHQDFTKTADYEGEIGVIIGKSGFRITESNAMDHVWGYTIINDMTARERQRDHKQFYLGKSLDTFCPMVPSSHHLSSCSFPAEYPYRGPLQSLLGIWRRCCECRPTSMERSDKMRQQRISFSQYHF